jgi:hypothetical protein
VLSWVSPEKRKALLDFAKAKLKPGGLLHVSYNAMPGWASVEPIRQQLLFGGESRKADSSIERARAGLAFARAMQGAGADYFAENPAASDMLETMAKAGLPYLVHEYLHEHWTPMYFARVAWEMAASDLEFAGVLPVHLNFRDTAVSETQERLLASVADRATFESLKDFANNEFFRRDVYVKGTATRSADATATLLDSTTWGTLADELPAGRTVSLPHRTVSLAGPPFEALFAALAGGAATLDELASRPELAGLGREELRAALLRLVVTEQVVPMRAPAGPRLVANASSAANATDRFCVPSVYNQMMLRRLSSETPIVMVSTVAGTAFPLSALEGMAIRVITEAAPAEQGAWVDDLVGRSVLRIRVGDRVLDDRAAQRAAILESVEQLRRRLSKFVELGILAVAK